MARRFRQHWILAALLPLLAVTAVVLGRALFDRGADRGRAPSTGSVQFASGPDGEAALRGLGSAADRDPGTAPDVDSEADLDPAGPGEGLALAGRIVWPDGTPLSDGLVFVSSETAGSNSQDLRSAVLAVGEDGRFRRESLSPGRYVISAGFLTWGRRILTDVPGSVWRAEAGETDLVLVFDPDWERTLAIRVLGPDGELVTSGHVDVEHVGGSLERASLEIRAGRANVLLQDPMGRVLVDVTRARSASGTVLGSTLYGPVEISSKQVEIRLPAGRRVTGRVEGPDGRGVEGVGVRVLPVGPALAQIRIDAADHARASTDASGRFVLRGLGDARYSVQVGAPVGFVPVEAFLEPEHGTEIEVRLVRAVTARIRVVDPQGAPVEGARLDLSGAQFHRVSTNGDGVAVFDRLDPAETYGIQVFPPEDRAELGYRYVPDWKPADTTIRLDEASRVRGVVRYRSGEAAPYAGVWWWNEKHRTWWARQADRDGRFLVELRGVSGSSVRLRAGDDDGEPDEDGVEEVEVDVGATDVVLLMDRGVSLEIEVPGWPSDSDGSARLRAEGELDLTRTWGATATFGTIRFDHLRAGETYSLSIVGVGDGLAAERAGLRPEDGPIEVGLAPGKTIRGRMVLPEGAEYARLTAGRGRHWAEGTVNAAGAFEVRGLTGGRWRLEATVRAGGTYYHGEAEVLAGETVDVVVGLRPSGR